MKQLTAILVAMFMIATPLSVLSVTGSVFDSAIIPFGGGAFGGGDGTIGNPYNITDVLDLQAMQGNLGAHYLLANSIDASATFTDPGNWPLGFVPIGNSVTPFTGSLDGRGYNITNLFINRITDDTGLFGGIGVGGHVLNVTLININYTGNNRIGGIVGDSNGGIVENCIVSGKITGTSGNAGGIVGRNRVNGLVKYCQSNCNISAVGSRDGGIVGQNVGGADILNCQAHGQVNGTRAVGGIAGYHVNSGSRIQNSSSSGLVIGTGYYTGGCVGEQSDFSIIEDSMSSGTAINYGASNTGIGGFVGSSQFSTTIQRCGSTGDVSSPDPTFQNVGGFIGITLYLTIRDCYATGSASGADCVGGFVGSNDASGIERCFSSGVVSGSSRTGGFMGFNTSSPVTITSCYWDNETSGQTVGVWNASIPGIMGKSTSEMMIQSTFTGWDFGNTWVMIGDHNYPKLRGTFTPIYDVHDLQNMNNNLDADYILMNDIDANETTGWNGGEGFVPVGNATDPYNGMFWGQGYTISNLFMSRPVTYQGLFGHISSTAIIENVILENVSITGWQFKAALVGYNSGGKIYDSTCSGIIGTAGSNTGGIVGRMVGGIIDNCTSSCIVTSSNGNNIGGFGGSVYGGEIITNSIASGNVNGVDNVGGFIGAHSGDNSTIDHCSAFGTVSSTGKCIGGFVGQNYNGAEIYNSSATGSVSCTGPTVGIIGTGGFVGSNYWSANGPTVIQFCYASGDVTGTVAVGGFVGGNGDTAQACIFDCYSLGDAHATSNTVGGFMGSGSEGPIMRCYSTGAPSATGGGVGGFAGYVGFGIGSNYQNNRWDITTSGMGVAISAGNSSQIFGNTTAQLLQQATYNGSDFTNDWWMVDGQTRPFLRMEWGAEITNSHQLQMMQMNLTANYTLANDIDMSGIVEPSQMWGTNLTQGRGFLPVGNASQPYSGKFDGKNFSISNLFINRSIEDFIGLFGYTNRTEFKNVQIEDACISGRDYIGGLIGYNLEGDITNCQSTGNISGKGDVGVLVGCNNAGTIDNCHSTGTAKGTEGDIGGLIGWNIGGTVTNCTSHTNIPLAKKWAGGLIGYSNGLVNNCTAYGDIVGTNDWIGGLIGQMLAGGAISNCSAHGNVSGTYYIGGLIGENAADIENSDANGNVTGTGDWIGGLVGTSSGLIDNCHASGDVAGRYFVGGLVGRNYGGVSQSNATGTVGGNNSVGGLVGVNWGGSVDGSHATGDVSGWATLGGLVGYSVADGFINNSYAIGDVAGFSDLGGLIGTNDVGTINNSYATGNVNGSYYAGGFAGDNYDTISNSHSLGTVSGGTNWIGGFFGENTGSITGCSSVGNATGTEDYIGGFGGYSHGAASIVNCISAGNASGFSYIGGFAGDNEGGAITNCSSTGDVNSNGGNNVGGLIGYNSGTVDKCQSDSLVINNGNRTGGLIGYSEGQVSNSTSFGIVSNPGTSVNRYSTGGLIGEQNGLTVSFCYAYGNVTGNKFDTGGLIGTVRTGTTVSNCSAHGKTNSTMSYAGGLVGTNWGAIIDSHAYGDTGEGAANAWVGGFVGHNVGSGMIQNSSAHGDVFGGANVGGFVGQNLGLIERSYCDGAVSASSSNIGGFVGQNGMSVQDGDINDCYSRGSVTGDYMVGGFAGNHTYTGSTLTHVYSTGSVTANTRAGGLVGEVFDCTVSDSFWDTETSGWMTSAGGTGKTTAEMMTLSTFTNWDFATVWGIYEANTYPFLRAFGIPPEPEADLEITLDDIADLVQLGSAVTYRAVIINHGQANAAGIHANVTLPPGTSFINSTLPFTVNGRYLEADPSNMAAGETVVAYINASVDTFTTGVINCTAFVTSGTADPEVYTNNTYETTQVNRLPIPWSVPENNHIHQITEDYVFNYPSILWNAFDPDSDPITVTGNEPSDYGAAVTILANGSFTYDPTVSATLQALHDGETVYDTFNYTISDGRGGFASALITMQVDGQEGYPVAHNDTFVIQEDSGANVLDVLANDVQDEEGDAITILEASLSSWWHGTLAISGGGTTLTFTPTENFYGTVNFSYAIHISTAPGGWGYGTLSVLNVNDQPAITSADVDETLTRSPYLVNYTATDIDGDSLTWSVTTNATWLSINASGALSGTPDNSDAGVYSVSVRVSDGHGGYDWSNFTLTVLLDTDGDGIPDSEDPDIDGDGVPNEDDLDPLDPDIGAEMPPADTDGDGVPDSEDAFPTDPAASVDTDGDGMPDAWNPGYTAEDSTTGLVLDDDPNTPFSDGPGSNIWLYIVIILVIVCIAGAAWWLWPKKPSPEKFDPQPAKPEEEPPNFKTDPSDANKVEPKENIAEDGAVTYVESQTPYDRLG